MNTNKAIAVNKKTSVADIDIIDEIGTYSWWDDNVKLENKKQFRKELKRIENLDVNTIKLNILGCLGGDVNHALNIHDMLALSSSDVESYYHGYCASAATIVAQPGKRYMSDNAMILIHNASNGLWGNKNDMETNLEHLVKLDKRLANIYAKASGKSLQFFLDLMDENNGNGKWLNADEALEYGLIDEIFEPTEAQASAVKQLDAATINKYHIPVPNNKATKKISFMNKIKAQIKALKSEFDKFKDGSTPDNSAMKDLKTSFNTLQADFKAKSKKFKNKLDSKDTEISNLKAQIKKLEKTPKAKSTKSKSAFSNTDPDEDTKLINAHPMNKK